MATHVDLAQIEQEINQMRPEPRMEMISVTPQLAEKWLQFNTHNRKPSLTTVSRYAVDMQNGRWRQATGETIIFDSRGQLQQGQHRLMAVVKSGVTIRFWVMFNADPDDFSVIDSGWKRTTASVLSVEGVKNPSAVAAVCRSALMLLNHAHVSWSGTSTIEVTNSAVIDFYESNREVVTKAAIDAEAARRAIYMPSAQFGAVAVNVMLLSTHFEQWNEFVQRCLSGDMLPADSPIFALRRWSLGRRGNAARGGSGSQQLKAALITKAWNAYVLDKPMKQLYWRREEIPMPRPLPSAY